MKFLGDKVTFFGHIMRSLSEKGEISGYGNLETLSEDHRYIVIFDKAHPTNLIIVRRE